MVIVLKEMTYYYCMIQTTLCILDNHKFTVVKKANKQSLIALHQ